MDDMELFKKLAQCEDKEQMQRVIQAHNESQKPQTNADRIRAMTDDELKYIARAVIKSDDCPAGETECIDCVFHDLCLRGDYYYNNEEEWLKQPAEENDYGSVYYGW